MSVSDDDVIVKSKQPDDYHKEKKLFTTCKRIYSTAQMQRHTCTALKITH